MSRPGSAKPKATLLGHPIAMQLKWEGGMTFAAKTPSGGVARFQTAPETPGTNEYPTPVEALVAALAACAAIDVVAILEKQRQKIDQYHVEIEYERVPEGTYPRPITAVRLRHVLAGRDLHPAFVERAVKLSDEKYCSVAATLRAGASITSDFEIR